MRGPYFVEGLPTGAVGTMPRPPGGLELERAMTELALRADLLVSLLGEREAREAGLADEGPVAEAAGLRFFHHPVGDLSVPADEQALIDLTAELAGEVRAGKRLVAHCWAGIGRATLLSAGVLVHLGWTGERAVEAISDVRGMQVPDTMRQRQWLLDLPARLGR